MKRKQESLKHRFLCHRPLDGLWFRPLETPIYDAYVTANFGGLNTRPPGLISKDITFISPIETLHIQAMGLQGYDTPDE